MIVDSHQHLWGLQRVEYPWLVPEFGSVYRTAILGEDAARLHGPRVMA